MTSVPAATAAAAAPSPSQHRTQFIRGVRDSMAKALAQGLGEPGLSGEGAVSPGQTHTAQSPPPAQPTAAAKSITGRLKQLIDKPSSEALLKPPSRGSLSASQTRGPVPASPDVPQRPRGTPIYTQRSNASSGGAVSLRSPSLTNSQLPLTQTAQKAVARVSSQTEVVRNVVSKASVSQGQSAGTASPVSSVSGLSQSAVTSTGTNSSGVRSNRGQTLSMNAETATSHGNLVKLGTNASNNQPIPRAMAVKTINSPVRVRTIVCKPLVSPQSSQRQATMTNVRQPAPSNLRPAAPTNVRQSPALNARQAIPVSSLPLITPPAINIRVVPTLKSAQVKTPPHSTLQLPPPPFRLSQESLKTMVDNISASVGTAGLKSPATATSLKPSTNNQKPIVCLSDEPSAADVPNRDVSDDGSDETEEKKRMLALAQLKLLQRKAAIVVSPQQFREAKLAAAAARNGRMGSDTTAKNVETGSEVTTGDVEDASRCASGLRVRKSYLKSAIPPAVSNESSTQTSSSTRLPGVETLLESRRGRPRRYPVMDKPQPPIQVSLAPAQVFPSADAEQRVAFNERTTEPDEAPVLPVNGSNNSVDEKAGGDAPLTVDHASPDASVTDSQTSVNTVSSRKRGHDPSVDRGMGGRSSASSSDGVSCMSSVAESSPSAAKKRKKITRLQQLSQDEGVINIMSELAQRGGDKKRNRTSENVTYRFTRDRKISEQPPSLASEGKRVSAPPTSGRMTRSKLSSPAAKLKAKALLVKKSAAVKQANEKTARKADLKAKLMKAKLDAKKSQNTILAKKHLKAVVKNETPEAKSMQSADSKSLGRKTIETATEKKTSTVSPSSAAVAKKATKSAPVQPKPVKSPHVEPKPTTSADIVEKKSVRATSQTKSVASQEKPTGDREKPAARDKPIVNQEKPVAKQKPTTNQETPVSSQAKPAANQKSTISQTKPSSSQDKSAANQKSTISQTKPFSSQDKSSANQVKPKRTSVADTSEIGSGKKSPSTAASDSPALKSHEKKKPQQLKLVQNKPSMNAVKKDKPKEKEAKTGERKKVGISEDRPRATSVIPSSTSNDKPNSTSSKSSKSNSPLPADPIPEPASPGSLTYGSLQRRLELATLKQVRRRVVPEDRERASSRSNLGTVRHREICVKKFERFHQVVLCPVTTRLKAGLNVQVMRELREYLSACARDPACRAVLLTSSAGPFCQGLDYSCLMGLSPEKRRRAAEELAGELKEFIRAVAGFNKPLIAGVTGSCVGLGLALLPLCDLVFISEKATMQTFYSRLGTVPEGGATHSLTALLGHMKAGSLLMTGRALTGSEAVQLNLATGLLWSATAYEELISQARHVLDNAAQVQALESTKALIRHPLRAKVEMALRSECPLLVHQWSAPEFQQRVKDLYESGLLQLQKAGFDTQ